jgi:FAD:protein FMN transferase
MRIVAIPASFNKSLPERPGASSKRRHLEGRTMGTSWRVDSYAQQPLAESVVQFQLDSVEAQMSHWREDSDLSQFGAAAAGEWVALPPEFFYVLDSALQVCAKTEGAFDPTIAPAVNAWGFGPRGRRDATLLPVEDASGANAAAGIQLDSRNRRALQPGGVSLDLSAIAKGFGVDRVANMLDACGITSYLVEVGGELRARGLKDDAQPWWIALEHPPDMPFPEVRVALANLSIATSGDYRKYFEHGGVRYSHTIDPSTGNPIRHAVASVSVLHEECMLADAYSTALTVMGPDKGIALADKLGLAALYVLRPQGPGSFRLRYSRAFGEMSDLPVYV